MKGFIQLIAEALYNHYGDDISSLRIMFPSRRAALFFNDALTQIAKKPIWQPQYVTVDQVMEEISGLRTGDHIRIIAELYKIYSKYHEETFDSFYFWGEMLLSDFDSIDKYLINPDILFTNISDLKEIENDFSYLTPEQIAIISKFWKTFGAESDFSEEKQKFFNIWKTLGPVYHQFQEALEGNGLAYTGMVFRKAAEVIEQQKQESISRLIINKNGEDAEQQQRYVVAGFNALSECEKKLFEHLAIQHHVDFFWDYDLYYLENKEQEAGLFMRDNIRRFPQKIKLRDDNNSFRKQKNITVVSSPSDSLQCKYAGEVLAEQVKAGMLPGKETAIVLTNENLLMPTLRSIPSSIEKINVTMGYPLKLTLAYSFVERLVQLQSRKKNRGAKTYFYHSDVTGLLNHPFVLETDRTRASELLNIIAKRNIPYVDKEVFDGNDPISEIFVAVSEEWEKISEYLLEIIARISQIFTQIAYDAKGEAESVADTRKQTLDFFTLIAETIRKTVNSLSGCDIELSQKTFFSVLRKILQNLRIPYEGEPLEGIQVMGILETRNIDFENVVILSVNDDTFPGNRAVSSSFIPYNLRYAYGLPTPQHHEGVYAYYFYRLLQKAKNIHIVYNSRSDEKSSGEQSRYIYQLEFESPHKIQRHFVGLNINLSQPESIEVAKSEDVMGKLKRFTEQETPVKLSPTAFFNYIACPLKFYFNSVARLRAEDAPAEEIDAPLFGTILHSAMEILYRPIKGIHDPAEKIKSLIGSAEVDLAVNSAIREAYLQGENLEETEYGGNLLLVKDIVCKYINTCILPYDASLSGFTITELEQPLKSTVEFESSGKKLSVIFGGIADRVEAWGQGSVVKVVDYKTGREQLDFKGVEALFSESLSEQNPAALQTILYAMMLHDMTGKETQPALYYIRQLNSKDYNPSLNDKSKGSRVSGYLAYQEEFEMKLRDTLNEMFNPDIPFRQCADKKQCLWCDFNEICKR